MEKCLISGLGRKYAKWAGNILECPKVGKCQKIKIKDKQ